MSRSAAVEVDNGGCKWHWITRDSIAGTAADLPKGILAGAGSEKWGPMGKNVVPDGRDDYENRFPNLAARIGMFAFCCRPGFRHFILSAHRPGLLSRAFVGIIRGYQRFVSPLFPPACRYYPSCSRYAVECLEKRSLPVAFAKIIWRLLRCNPFTRGGYDPVDPE